MEPGNQTTQFHFHHQFEVEAGDFMGFTAPSLPHCLKNTFEVDLVYLLGGERRNFDVCDYPRLSKRLFRFNGNRQLVDGDG